MPHTARPLQTAVVIVNYGTADLTAMAVDSVLRYHRDNPDVEVHVVDNASPGDDAAMIARHHAERGWGGQVVLHLETENHGFGRGNNVVLRQLAARAGPPEFVFFLNPDATLKVDSITGLVKALTERPQAGLVGCGIERSDGTAVTATFNFPNVVDEFLRDIPLGRLGEHAARFRVGRRPEMESCKVDWVSGAAFMARFHILHDLDFFDPDYFLYYEEVDLMRRLSLAGWEIWHITDLPVVHLAGAATGMQGGHHKSGRMPAYWYESWKLYFTKNHSLFYARITCIARLLGHWIGNAVHRAMGRSRKGPEFFQRDFNQHVLTQLFVKIRPDRDHA